MNTKSFKYNKNRQKHKKNSAERHKEKQLFFDDVKTTTNIIDHSFNYNK